MEFAVIEFNHYPKALAATRQRPHYVPARYQWPPKWVTDNGREGFMVLTKNEFLRYLMVIYLLGVKGLGSANLKDLFSKNPLLREEWLCTVTNLRDLTRFIRQVCGFVCVCVLLCVWPHATNHFGKLSVIFF